MRTAMRKSWPWRGKKRETPLFSKHTLYGPSVHSGCAVRRKSGAEGGRTKIRNPTPTPPCPPLDAIGWLFSCPVTASPATVSHYFPLFPIISRGVGGALEQVFKRRSPEIPEKCTKSRFSQENACSATSTAAPVALRNSFRLPQKEPMLRKGNAWPAFLTTRRGEVGERAVKARCEPLGARRRT